MNPHQHTKNNRRQFMGGALPGQMQAATIFGSKLKQPPTPANAPPPGNTMTNPSTKPGSQFTDEVTKTATSNLGLISSKQAAEDTKEESHLNNYVSDEVQKNNAAAAAAAAAIGNENSLI